MEMRLVNNVVFLGLMGLNPPEAAVEAPSQPLFRRQCRAARSIALDERFSAVKGKN
jgi:hypothetical protein